MNYTTKRKGLNRGLFFGMLVTLMVMFSANILAQFSGGTGTEGDPFQIATTEDLNNLRDYTGTNHSDVYFLQTADIDLDVAPYNEGNGWVPIGDNSNRFAAKYDGGGNTISNLFIRGTDRLGLFAYTGATTIQNLKIDNVDIAGNDFIGSLAAHIYGTQLKDIKVTNISIQSNDRYVGGIVGYARDANSSLENCYAQGQVTGASSVGGLVGYILTFTNIDYCVAEVNVTSTSAEFTQYIGGLVGRLSLSTNFPGNIYNSYATGAVYSPSTNGSRGGLVGRMYGGTVSHSYSIGSVNNGVNAGGLIGIIDNGNVVSSYYDTLTSGQEESAGGEGRTTQQMTYPYQNSFIDWDFDSGLWVADEDFEEGVNPGFNNGYPYLIWQLGDLIQYELTITIEGGGTTNPESGTYPYYEGREVTVEAIEVFGWAFEHWVVTVGDGEPQLIDDMITIIEITDNITATAVFVEFIAEYDLNIGVEGGGTTSPEPGTHVYDDRSEVELTAIPDENWLFDYWSIVVGEEEPQTFEEPVVNLTMTDNVYATAYFYYPQSPNPDITVNPVPEDGAMNISTDLEYLQWSYIIDENYTNPVGFRVYFADSGDFGEEYSWIDFDESQEDYTLSIPIELMITTQYYWKVVPTTIYDGETGGDAEDVPVWTFTTSAVSVEDDYLQPQVTTLHSNYPNPFNPQTTISFALAEQGKVSLNIFNNRGQKVVTLVDDTLPSGNYSFVWNGTDYRGNDQGSGVYFYHFTVTDNFGVSTATTKKMLLVK